MDGWMLMMLTMDAQKVQYLEIMELVTDDPRWWRDRVLSGPHLIYKYKYKYIRCRQSGAPTRYCTVSLNDM